MKWLIVIVFLGVNENNMQDLYILKKPSFNTPEHCYNHLANKPFQYDVVQKLTEEYGYYRPIQKILCAEEKRVFNLIDGRVDT